MSDRKYKQHGYQDRGPEPAARNGFSPEKKREDGFGPRKLQMPGTRQVSRCAQCGVVLPAEPPAQCPKCAADVHSCRQCTYFDTSKRFECMQPIPERIPKKDVNNHCTFYKISLRVEKETSTPVSVAPTTASDARLAFENLFKK